MELFLNLLWLVLSAALLRHTVVHARSRAASVCATARLLLVLGCVLLLLFPFISITDDLHASADAMEDWSFSVRKVRAVIEHPISPLSAGLLLLIASIIALAAPLAQLGWIVRQADIPPADSFIRVLPGRAPPLVIA